MLKVAVMVAAGLAGAPAQAQTLWQNLQVGMTKEQVAAAYPSKTIQLTPECAAKILPDYRKDGGLTSVMILAKPPAFGGASVRATAVACSLTVEESLTAKYGSPQLTDVEYWETMKQSTDVAAWVQDQVSVVFRSKREPRSDQRSPQWSVKYSVARQTQKKARPNIADKL